MFSIHLVLTGHEIEVRDYQFAPINEQVRRLVDLPTRTVIVGILSDHMNLTICIHFEDLVLPQACRVDIPLSIDMDTVDPESRGNWAYRLERSSVPFAFNSSS